MQTNPRRNTPTGFDVYHTGFDVYHNQTYPKKLLVMDTRAIGVL